MIVGWEWIVILIIAIVIILWGPQKIPELARALGRAKGEFDRAQKEFEEAAKVELERPLESGDDALIETAKKLGIKTEGKTKEQISQEIIERAKKSA
ncbi:twin-arginine translocase TatA/TatE family subunit [Candidatus Bathyarchaeota archaeon]|nr:twin-arginine translocase TatA/TatE family subunit [Candidatus Bathyarchaeota archaeon]